MNFGEQFEIIIENTQILNNSNTQQILKYSTKIQILNIINHSLYKNNMKKQHFTLFVVFFLFSFAAQAQFYKTAGGLRVGNAGFGLTVQQAVERHWTAEGILEGKLNSSSLSILAERHIPLATRRVNLYFGGGVHHIWASSNTTNPSGVTGIGGVEAAMGNLCLSLDIKPRLNLNPGKDFNTFQTQTGLSVRYIFIKAERPNLRFWERRRK